MTEYPRLSASCAFDVYDNGGGSEEYVLSTSDGRQYKVSGLARRILTRLDGKTSIAQIAADLSTDSIPITPEQLRVLLERKYASLGLIEDGSVAEPAGATRTVRRIGFPMLLTWRLVPQSVVAWLSKRLRFLYSPWAAVPLLGLIAWTHLPVYSASLPAATLSSEDYLQITALCLLSILIHELGHATAVSRYGGTPGEIGCGLYLLVPTFYADVSQLWRFRRRQRMVVDLGGAYFQQASFAVFALIALRTGSPEFLAVCRLIDLMVLTALNPLFHFDGYWFLADYLAMPKLQGTAFRFLGWRLRRWLRRPAEPLKLPDLGRLARWIFQSYSLLVGVFLVAAFWLVYRYLSATVIRFPIAAPEAFYSAITAFEQGDISRFLLQTVALFLLVAFPLSAVIGLLLLIARLFRRCADRLVRRRSRIPGDLPARRLA